MWENLSSTVQSRPLLFSWAFGPCAWTGDWISLLVFILTVVPLVGSAADAEWETSVICHPDSMDSGTGLKEVSYYWKMSRDKEPC